MTASSVAKRVCDGVFFALTVLLTIGCARFQTKEHTMTHIPGPAGSLRIDDVGAGGVPVVFVHSFAGSAAHSTAQLPPMLCPTSTNRFSFNPSATAAMSPAKESTA
jgi:hypothetical protein